MLTNYRAFVIGDERANMMRIDKTPDYRTEIQEDGTEIIYIGDACKTKASASRANTVLGVRKDKEDPSKITGLVFYGVKDAADVCSKYAAFANNIETLQDSRLWEFSPAGGCCRRFCRKEFLVRLLPVIVKLSYLKNI